MSDAPFPGFPQPLRILNEQPPKPKSTWEWLRDIGITGLFVGVISGLIAAGVGAYFQHNRWYVEQRLARSAADFEAATRTASSISEKLSEMQSLQEVLFFTYRAGTQISDPEELAYLNTRAAELFPIYEKGRLAQRQQMDSFIYAVRRHLDWPSGWNVASIGAKERSDPLNQGTMSMSSDFDCSERKTLPQEDGGAFKTSPFDKFTVDWNSASHHLTVFGYCFRKLHDKIRPARFWAGAHRNEGDAPRAPKRLSDADANLIILQLNHQIYRLNRFNALTLMQVERIRERNQPPDFWSYLFLRPAEPHRAP